MDTVLVVRTAEGAGPWSALRSLGYAVAECRPDALPALLDDRMVADCVVLELAGSWEERRDLVDFIEAHPSTRSVPVVILADAADPDVVRSPGVDVVASPCSPGRLAARVATAVRLRKTAGTDERTATVAAHNAALRDVNDRLMREREEARRIQRALLPAALPAGPGFEVAVSYVPLDEVGGDWYSAVESGGVVDVHVADVTGHGLAAALLGAMTKLALTVCGAAPGPAARLAEIDRVLGPELPDGRFVTMALARLVPSTGEAFLAGAGHPPAFVLRADGRVEPVKPAGFPVGFGAESPYEEIRISLDPGDSVVLITDGVTEARARSGEMFGSAGAAAALRDAAGKEAGGVIRTMLGAVDAFRDGRMIKDDATVLVLRRRPAV